MNSKMQVRKLTLAVVLLAAGTAACSKNEADSKPSPSASASASASGSAAAVIKPPAPSPEACRACEQQGTCAELSDPCAKFEGEARSQCEAVSKCVETTNCADGDRTLTSCYCGELKTSDCIDAPLSGPKAPAGACADVIRKSLGGADLKQSQILTRYLKVEHPGGAAIARMNCDKLDPACRTPCGF